MDESCVFCGIVAGRLPARFVYQDEYASAFLDIRPLRAGHTLVVPRRHLPDLSADGAPDAMTAIGPALQATTRILLNRLNADGLSVLQANGAAAGQEVFHLVPRRRGDRPLNDWTADHDARHNLDAIHQQLVGSED